MRCGLYIIQAEFCFIWLLYNIRLSDYFIICHFVYYTNVILLFFLPYIIPISFSLRSFWRFVYYTTVSSCACSVFYTASLFRGFIRDIFV